jgi:hypothetical protein
MRPFRCIWIVAALGVLVPHQASGQSGAPAAVAEERYLEHVKYLASDELAGRGNGTEGLERAAEYIAKQLERAGLSPGGENGSWFQPFQIVTGLDVRDGNRLTLGRPGAPAARFELGRSYLPLSVDADGQRQTAAADLELPLVFAGYGISAPGLKYDDYEGLDVRGKAVLVFMHEPQEEDANSAFDGRAFTQHASLMQKAMVARGNGARLLLLVIDPSHESDAGNFAGWLKDPQADDFGISVMRVERGALEQALAGVIDLEAVAKDIDRDVRPRSRSLDGISITLAERFAKIRRPVRNVVGLLQGSDPSKRKEAVVIGAHYDHLGLGGRHSMSPDLAGQIHNGADDNASGTAALLEIARVAAARRAAFARTLVFVAFAGEELGLLGSAHYVDHPSVPLEQTVAMINLDMMGRPSGRILLSGIESAPSLDEDVKAAGAGRGVEIRAFREGAGVGSSDDTTFMLRSIPAIGFFSGFHGDYHRPSDDWQHIDAAGAVEVTRIALALTERLANRAERPAFVAAAPRPRQAGGGGGYGAYFGSVPDFGEGGSGVKFADVRPGSPAEKGGLRRGDVLVRFDGAEIATIHDFTFALRNHKPGDTVKVVVMRDGAEVEAEVTLATRQ